MNILIVEDEAHAAELLKDLIENQSNFSVVSIQDSIESTIDYLNNAQDGINLIFMDIQLADGQCFEIFNHVEVSVPIVFCTAHDEYIMQAFKSNGIDYILKPFDDNEVLKAIEKVKRIQSSFLKNAMDSYENIQSIFQGSKTFQKTIIAEARGKMCPIEVKDILLFHLENETINIYSVDQKVYVLFKTMNEIEEMVDDKRFFRINRQMIINRDAVKFVEPHFNRKVSVHATIPIQKEIIVSRLKVTPFMNWLENPV
ncbi:MAG: hypothetical protein AVO39_07540 [delta proteobacterium MLS_D]|jgi:two-component system, LytTR family, response regulator LytT|nr:MAG: hypothetical protein AVO39_07540 [delta proteobacterium MLS_D]